MQNYVGNVSAVRNDTLAIYDGWKYDVGKSQAVGMAQTLIPKLDSATRRIDSVILMGNDVASSIARYQQMYPQALKNATLAAEWNRANNITVTKTIHDRSLPIQIINMLDQALYEKNATRVGHLFGEEGRTVNVMQSGLHTNLRLDKAILGGANQLLTSLNFTTTSAWKVPGYATIAKAGLSLLEPAKQLDQCLIADKVDLDIIKNNLINPQAADVSPVLPRHRAMLKSFSENIGKDVKTKFDSFLSSAQKDNVAQIQNVLGKLAAEPEFVKQVADSVSAGLRRGSIRSISDMIVVMNPAVYGFENERQSYGDRYNPQMLEKIIVKNTSNMTDQELALAIRNNVNSTLRYEMLPEAVQSVGEAFRKGVVDGIGDSIVVSQALAIHGIPAGISGEYTFDWYGFGAYIRANQPELYLGRNTKISRIWVDRSEHLQKTRHIEFVPYLNSAIPLS